MHSLTLLRITALIAAIGTTGAFITPAVAAVPAVADAAFTGKLATAQLLATAAGTRVNAPADWTVSRSEGMTVFESPEKDTRVAIVELKAADAAAALRAAWDRMGGPNAKRKQLLLQAAPARSGWDQRVIAEYDVPSDTLSDVEATALRHGDLWSVVVLDGSNATVGKRGAAIRLLRDSVRPGDYTPEDFSGRKAHPLNAERIAQVRAFLEQALKDTGVPGVGYALIDGGKVVYEGGVGVRELGKPALVDANTMFMAASNTKGMSTLLLATLADEGKLRWDQPVAQLYPSFKLGSAETTAQVLVKHLVCACTGLPRQDMEWIFEYRNTSALDSMALLGKNNPTSGFGELFQYNNLMASAAGYVGANLIYPKMELGKAYDKAMQERIFTPLGMNATTFDSPRALRGNHAAPHATGYDNRPTVVPFEMNKAVYPHRPAGGVWTTPHDFAQYVLLEANLGKLPDGKQLVSAQNLLMRRQPGVSAGKDQTYGMGLWNARVAGVDVVQHGGSLFGYKSNFMLLPDYGVGAVILTNSDEGRQILAAFRRRMLEILFDGKPEAAEDLKASAEMNAKGRRTEAALLTSPPAPALMAQLGTHYRSKELGEVWIRRKGKNVILDAGEWQSPLASRKNEGGKDSLVTTTPDFAGLELLLGEVEGQRALLLHDAQHEYKFVEVK